MKLSENLLSAGDNYYTSIELANRLLDKGTHLLGILQSNRRGNLKEVTSKKLKHGEVFGKENNRGIFIFIGKNRWDV